MYPHKLLPMVTLLSGLCLGLSACSGGFPPRIYRMDISQGNVLKPEMVKQLRLGMTKAQVQDIMGTPALSHSLNTNRWDYYYSFTSGNRSSCVQKIFSIFFSNGKVVHWEGNY